MNIYQKDKEVEKFIQDSPTLNKYKQTLRECIMLYYPRANMYDVDAAIEYSIRKRFRDSKNVKLINSYKRYRDENDNYKDLEQQINLKKLSDYIISREPIVTAGGVLFKHHGVEPNPMNDVIQSFLKLRSEHKSIMFNYPKGSEDFEKYNLLQSLDKIDANGVYGYISIICKIYHNSTTKIASLA